jgi:hypothetical protein
MNMLAPMALPSSASAAAVASTKDTPAPFSETLPAAAPMARFRRSAGSE